ncbi:MAG: electron transfer flavoprotein subunit alpha/FixB family protein [Alphaproteobacteria bacterium]
MTVLVLAEHDDGVISRPSRSTITAARAIADAAATTVTVLVPGFRAGDAVAMARRLTGVDRVNRFGDDGAANGSDSGTTGGTAGGTGDSWRLAGPLAALLARESSRYSHVLAPATSLGQDVLPRLAGLLERPMVSDIVQVRGAHRFVRPERSGQMLVPCRTAAVPVIATVRSIAFDPTAELPASSASAPVEAIQPPPPDHRARLISRARPAAARSDLTQARAIVAGGRGFRSADDWALLQGLAEALGAEVGASRTAIDGGLAPLSALVGQSGARVAPELYVAVAISGAVHHVDGMKGSKVVVAINRDPMAPILRQADFALLGDYQDLLPRLVAALQSD